MATLKTAARPAPGVAQAPGPRHPAPPHCREPAVPRDQAMALPRLMGRVWSRQRPLGAARARAARPSASRSSAGRPPRQTVRRSLRRSIRRRAARAAPRQSPQSRRRRSACRRSVMAAGCGASRCGHPVGGVDAAGGGSTLTSGGMNGGGKDRGKGDGFGTHPRHIDEQGPNLSLPGPCAGRRPSRHHVCRGGGGDQQAGIVVQAHQG